MIDLFDVVYLGAGVSYSSLNEEQRLALSTAKVIKVGNVRPEFLEELKAQNPDQQIHKIIYWDVVYPLESDRFKYRVDGDEKWDLDWAFSKFCHKHGYVSGRQGWGNSFLPTFEKHIIPAWWGRTIYRFLLRYNHLFNGIHFESWYSRPDRVFAREISFDREAWLQSLIHLHKSIDIIKTRFFKNLVVTTQHTSKFIMEANHLRHLGFDGFKFEGPFPKNVEPDVWENSEELGGPGWYMTFVDPRHSYVEFVCTSDNVTDQTSDFMRAYSLAKKYNMMFTWTYRSRMHRDLPVVPHWFYTLVEEAEEVNNG
jgi:hypothetical protein